MTKELREEIELILSDYGLYHDMMHDKLVALFDRYATERERKAFSEGYEAGLRRGETETKLKIAKGELSVSLKESTK